MKLFPNCILCRKLWKEGGSTNMFEWHYSKDMILLSRHPHCLVRPGKAFCAFNPSLEPGLCVKHVVSDLAWQREIRHGVDGRFHWLQLQQGRRKHWEQAGDMWADLKLRVLGGQAVGGFAAHKLDEIAIVPSHNFCEAFCPVLSLFRLTAMALTGSDWCSAGSSAVGPEQLCVLL